MHSYPVGIRFLIFAAVPAVLLIAVALDFLLRHLTRYRTVVVAALFAVLMAPNLISTMARSAIWPPFDSENVPAMVDFLTEHMQPDDKVYVYNAAVPAYALYTQGTPLQGRPTYVARTADVGWDYLALDAAALPSGRDPSANLARYGGLAGSLARTGAVSRGRCQRGAYCFGGVAGGPRFVRSGRCKGRPAGLR